MNLKVRIHCYTCDCDFELTGVKIVNLDAVRCPNCETAYPDEQFKHLKTGMSEFNKVAETITVHRNDTWVNTVPLFDTDVYECPDGN